MVGMSSFDGIFLDVSSCKISTKSVKRLPRKLNFFFKKSIYFDAFFLTQFTATPCTSVYAGYGLRGQDRPKVWCIGVPKPRGKPWRPRNDRSTAYNSPSGQNCYKIKYSNFFKSSKYNNSTSNWRKILELGSVDGEFFIVYLCKISY